MTRVYHFQRVLNRHNLVILLCHLIQHVVFAIAGTFLYHVDHFRRYSTFCASLHKLKDILGELQHRYIVA